MAGIFTAAKAKVLDAIVDALANATPVDSGEARAGWRHDGAKIINDVAHVTHLNDGSSKQAPQFFVEKTVLSNPDVRPSGTIVTRT